MATFYDPPSGWMHGFPKEYDPRPSETIAQTLVRDGYPAKDAVWAADHCRFWGDLVDGQVAEKKLVPESEPRIKTTPLPAARNTSMPAVLGAPYNFLSNPFVALFNRMAEDTYQVSKDHGFEPDDQNKGEKLALIHSEISEALEATRYGDPADDHIPNFTGSEAELADAVIRIMNYAQHNKLRVADAIVAKNKYNRTRPFKHGKVF